jgi:hypothetical protein
VLNVPGDPGVRASLLSRILGNRLAAEVPSLLNAPGITVYGERAAPAPFFHDNTPLRDHIPLAVSLADGTDQIIQSPVVNTVVGAMPIQEFVEHTEWVFQSGNSVTYGRHLRRDPLPRVPPKPVLIQFAKGDQVLPNPVTTAILRAGRLADRATFYRHDLAFAENPLVGKNPHGFIYGIGMAATKDIAVGALAQIAEFFASDGTTIIHPDPARFFEVPVVLPLPEDLNYIP